MCDHDRRYGGRDYRRDFHGDFRRGDCRDMDLMVPGIVTGIVVTIGNVATIGIIIRTVALMVPVMTILMGHSTLDATLSATLKSLKS